MIENERQLEITTKWRDSFKEWLTNLKKGKPEDMHEILYQAYIESVESQIEKFEQDIEEYNNKSTLDLRPIDGADTWQKGDGWTTKC